jgi:pimeloyl-ACP methyl ester carboxylesterase
MPSVRIRDYDMYFEEEGHGDPLLLLHGGAGSIAEWASAIPLYAQHYRVIATDRYGYGRSSDRPGFAPDFLRQDALDQIAFLSALDIEKVHVMGYSDGGSIALLMALERPDLVRSLVLYAAHSHIEESIRNGLRSVRERILSSPKIQERLGPRNFKRAMAWHDCWLESGAGLDIRSQLGRIHCPALVIQGMDDEFAGPAHAEGIARRISGAELWLIPETTHALRRRDAETFDVRVLDFLNKH